MQFLKYILLVSILSMVSVSNLYAAETMQSVEQQLKVNINTASVDELVMLPGIGKKKAQMLIDFREKNGEFTDIQQITDIKGFGTKLLTKLQDKIVLK